MQKNQAEELVNMIKNGAVFCENIFEGSITIIYEDLKYKEHQYQNNPYSGVDRNRILYHSNEELIEWFLNRDYKIMKECIVL